jgi:hypothetical protein
MTYNEYEILCLRVDWSTSTTLLKSHEKFSSVFRRDQTKSFTFSWNISISLICKYPSEEKLVACLKSFSYEED